MSEALQSVKLDVQALIGQAITAGAPIETLERLVVLAKDVRDVQAREAWYAAMAEFQRQCPSIKKTSTAQIQSERGRYSYNYAPLDEIMTTIKPIMGPLGLSVSWRSPRVETNHVVIACRVAHRLGHVEDSGEFAMPIGAGDRGGMNPAQRVASATSYGKRYSLLNVIGLAPEDDDDAASLSEPPRYTPPRREPRARPVSNEEAAYPTEVPTEIDDERQVLKASIEESLRRRGASKRDAKTLFKGYLGTEEPNFVTVDIAALTDLANKLSQEAGTPGAA